MGTLAEGESNGDSEGDGTRNGKGASSIPASTGS